VTDERIAEMMGWHWPTSLHPDDMLAKVRAVVREAKRELHDEMRNALDSADIKQRMGT
jgi:hypothetical protein